MSLTAEQHAVVVGHLRWAATRFADFTEAAGTTRLESVTSLLRHHRQLWDHQQPESILLSAVDRVRPATADLAKAFEELDPAADDVPAVVVAVLQKVDDDLAEVGASAGAIADAALLRAIAEVRGDGDHVRSRLGGAGVAATTSGEIVRTIQSSRIVALPTVAEA